VSTAPSRPCPACGDRAPVRTWSIPGQFLATDARFEAAECPCGQRYLADEIVEQEALYGEGYPLHRGPSLWGPFAPVVAYSDARTDARRSEVVRGARALGPGDTVLDLGCGRGSFLEDLHARTGAHGIGLDMVAPSNASAPWRAPANAAVRCVPGVLPDVPEAVRARAPFAVVTMWHVLEHDPDPRRTLAWVREHLAPGGVLVVEVPDGSSPLARALGGRWAGLHTPRHVSFFDPASLRRLCEGAGFEILDHQRAGTLMPYTLVALSAADHAGFRFDRHPAWALFPFWMAGLVGTWPLLGRASAQGLGLQMLVAA
jgi:2-polyprenyl-3-methyl-5-hydroxy-6-metoxy-1,4-benzoquinol methylase